MNARLRRAEAAPAATFRWPVRVYYEDTDSSGVVYHASYLRYFERARTEWLRTMRLSQQAIRGSRNVVFTVANMEIDFLRAARLDDELEVRVVIEPVRAASLTFVQTLHRIIDPDIVLTRARVRVGCVDAGTFRPTPLPEEFLEGVKEWHRNSPSPT
jgi:acyl-CoA thioester hydrolase